MTTSRAQRATDAVVGIALAWMRLLADGDPTRARRALVAFQTAWNDYGSLITLPPDAPALFERPPATIGASGDYTVGTRHAIMWVLQAVGVEDVEALPRTEIQIPAFLRSLGVDDPARWAAYERARAAEDPAPALAQWVVTSIDGASSGGGGGSVVPGDETRIVGRQWGLPPWLVWATLAGVTIGGGVLVYTIGDREGWWR